MKRTARHIVFVVLLVSPSALQGEADMHLCVGSHVARGRG